MLNIGGGSSDAWTIDPSCQFDANICAWGSKETLVQKRKPREVKITHCTRQAPKLPISSRPCSGNLIASGSPTIEGRMSCFLPRPTPVLLSQDLIFFAITLEGVHVDVIFLPIHWSTSRMWSSCFVFEMNLLAMPIHFPTGISFLKVIATYGAGKYLENRVMLGNQQPELG